MFGDGTRVIEYHVVPENRSLRFDVDRLGLNASLPGSRGNGTPWLPGLDQWLDLLGTILPSRGHRSAATFGDAGDVEHAGFTQQVTRRNRHAAAVTFESPADLRACAVDQLRRNRLLAGLRQQIDGLRKLSRRQRFARSEQVLLTVVVDRDLASHGDPRLVILAWMLHHAGEVHDHLVAVVRRRVKHRDEKERRSAEQPVRNHVASTIDGGGVRRAIGERKLIAKAPCR